MLQRKTRGFSLMEVLIVIMVLGLLFALISPNYFRYARSKAALSAVVSFVGDVEKARYIALQKENEVRIDFTTLDGNLVYSVYQYDPASLLWQPVRKEVNIHDRYSGTRIQNIAAVSASFKYGIGGDICSVTNIPMITEVGADTKVDYYPIVFENGGCRYMVKIYSTGLVRWEQMP